MFKKAVQRGRNEGRAEDVPLRYVEALSEVRTKLAAFFNILLAIAAQSVPYTSRRRECGIADWEVPDVRETYHWHRPQ
jgi:hypothetical protein